MNTQTALFNNNDVRGGFRFFRWLSVFATITVMSTAWTNSPAPVYKHVTCLCSYYADVITDVAVAALYRGRDNRALVPQLYVVPNKTKSYNIGTNIYYNQISRLGTAALQLSCPGTRRTTDML